MSETTETDKAGKFWPCEQLELVDSEFARQLERERDEAREKCANLHDIAERMIEYVGHTAAYEKLRAELDKLKEGAK
jgi:hypothetical protein